MTYHENNQFMFAQTTRVLFPKTGTKVHVRVATSEAEKQRGLHGSIGLDPNTGMLFQFVDQKPPLAMTMANMMIPLDILFIDRDGKVQHIAHRCAARRAAPVLGPAVQWVLEVPANFARRNRVLRGDIVIVGAAP